MSNSAPAVSPARPKRSTVLPALVAATDVVLAVLANEYFEGYKIPVIAAGVVFVLLTSLNVKSEHGEQILSWARIRPIVTARIFIALMAAAVAAGVTVLVMHAVEDKPATTVPGGGGAAPPATATGAPSSAPGCEDEGVPVKRLSGKLTFCPVVLNNGAPITGPFTVAGRILGDRKDFQSLIIVNRADMETCDALGNRPAQGYFYAAGLTIADDGTWEFRDTLGYDEAVTIGRQYAFLSGTPAALKEIRDARQVFADHHNGDDSAFPGLITLPAGVRFVATFRQAPGTYEGKGSPCKNE
jgi:hypothetical protein